MSEMIDRVARVIRGSPDVSPEALAVAVIWAMREPTEAMIAGSAGIGTAFAGERAAIWRRMTDEALKGSPRQS